MARPSFLAAPSKTVTISTVLELPGAIFYGNAINDPDALDSAVRRQAIRADFEATDCLTTLRHKLLREGFGCDEIAAAALDPRTITDCGYGLPPGY
jgi:hypothetical protein